MWSISTSDLEDLLNSYAPVGIVGVREGIGPQTVSSEALPLKVVATCQGLTILYFLCMCVSVCVLVCVCYLYKYTLVCSGTRVTDTIGHAQL